MKTYNKFITNAARFLVGVLLSIIVSFFMIDILDYSTQTCPAHHTFTTYKRCDDCKVSRSITRGPVRKHVKCPQQLQANNNSHNCIYPITCKVQLILNYIYFISIGIVLIGGSTLLIYTKLFRN